MGYHVTILRTKYGQPEPITLAEVKKVIALMPGFKLQSSASFKEDIEISFPLSNGGEGFLFWQNGEIWTKNPEDEHLQIMLDLAEKLNARVRGDEMETYRAIGESYTHPDDLVAIHDSERIIRAARCRLWLLRSAIFAGLILLSLLVSYFSH